MKNWKLLLKGCLNHCEYFCYVRHLCELTGSRTVGNNHLAKSIFIIKHMLYRPPWPCRILNQKKNRLPKVVLQNGFPGTSNTSESTKPCPSSLEKAALPYISSPFVQIKSKEDLTTLSLPSKRAWSHLNPFSYSEPWLLSKYLMLTILYGKISHEPTNTDILTELRIKILCSVEFFQMTLPWPCRICV